MPSTNKPYILYAEDNATHQHLIKTTFKNNYDFLAVSNGQECLNALKDRLPDVILMDVNMPVMSGVDACKIIKENPQTAHLKVIMLSASATTAHTEEGLNAGADLYITKPCNITKLREAVSNIIKSNQQAPSNNQLPPIKRLADSIYHLVLDDIKDNNCAFCTGALSKLITEHKMPKHSALIVEPTTDSYIHSCEPEADATKHFGSIAYILAGDGHAFKRQLNHATNVTSAHPNSAMFANYEDAYNWSVAKLAVANN